MSFNQPGSMFAVSNGEGYGAYGTCPFGVTYASASGPMKVVELLFVASVVILVGSGEEKHASPRRVVVFNTKRGTKAKELVFGSPVVGVRINRRRLVVAEAERISVYDMDNKLKLITRIEVGSSAGDLGLLSLTPSPDPDDGCYLAYPKAQVGDVATCVVLVDALNLADHILIQAHKSASVAALAFSYDGSMLASASEHGTVIRVFGIPSCDPLYEFRRGTSTATIYSLAFDPHNDFLAASSSSGTIGVYKLAAPEVSVVDTMFSYLPAAVSSAWDPQRRFASITGDPDVVSIVSFGALTPTEADMYTENTIVLQVITKSAWFRRYLIDTRLGGEARLLEQFYLPDQGSFTDLAKGFASASASGPTSASASSSATATASSASTPSTATATASASASASASSSSTPATATTSTST